jgi:hypothetical protein
MEKTISSAGQPIAASSLIVVTDDAMIVNLILLLTSISFSYGLAFAT